MRSQYDKGLIYKNITGNTAQILIDVKENISGQLYYISLCNVHDGDDAYIGGVSFDGTGNICITSAVFGCTDPTAFNYNNLANVDNGGCLPIITGCMQPLAFNYNPNANTPDTCIQVIFGCTSPIAFNYNPLANTDDGSCQGVVYGCTDRYRI